MATPSSGSNVTMPPAFFQLYVAGVPLGFGVTNEVISLTDGQYTPVIGELLPVWEPGMRHGRGSYTRFRPYGASIGDILVSAKVITAATLNSIGVDFRFLPLSISAIYTNPTGGTTTTTLMGVQFTETTLFRIDRADQLIRESGSFVFQYYNQQ